DHVGGAEYARIARPLEEAADYGHAPDAPVGDELERLRAAPAPHHERGDERERTDERDQHDASVAGDDARQPCGQRDHHHRLELQIPLHAARVLAERALAKRHPQHLAVSLDEVVAVAAPELLPAAA